ncbi:unnamed protein product, partial [Phaeothamnion confervicola]
SLSPLPYRLHHFLVHEAARRTRQRRGGAASSRALAHKKRCNTYSWYRGSPLANAVSAADAPVVPLTASLAVVDAAACVHHAAAVFAPNAANALAAAGVQAAADAAPAAALAAASATEPAVQRHCRKLRVGAVHTRRSFGGRRHSGAGASRRRPPLRHPRKHADA